MVKLPHHGSQIMMPACLKGLITVILPLILIISMGQACSKNAEYFRKRGDLNFQRSEFNEAIVNYITVISKYPPSETRNHCLFRLAQIYHHYMYNPDKALQYYNQILIQAPESHNACDAELAIGDIYQMIYAEYERAVEEYEKVLIHCKDLAKRAIAQKKIGDAYFNKGNYEQALIEYRNALRMKEIQSIRMNLLKSVADCNFILGNMMNAEKGYRLLMRYYPTLAEDAEIPSSLALTLLNQKEFCLAMEVYSDLCKRFPARRDLQKQYKKAALNCKSKGRTPAGP